MEFFWCHVCYIHCAINLLGQTTILNIATNFLRRTLAHIIRNSEASQKKIGFIKMSLMYKKLPSALVYLWSSENQPSANASKLASILQIVCVEQAVILMCKLTILITDLKLL